MSSTSPESTLNLRQIGNSVGMTIPKELLAELKVDAGDTLFVTHTPDGIHLSAHDPRFAQAMTASRAVAKKYRNALRELSK